MGPGVWRARSGDWVGGRERNGVLKCCDGSDGDDAERRELTPHAIYFY